jgi:hypothetical protein
MQLARLGRPWLVWSALADFRRACKIKERKDTKLSDMGEALLNRGLTEFAIANALHFRRRNALGIMREAVGYLESDMSPGRAGFAVSAKRKFADALQLAGRIDEAKMQREEAIALARRFGIISQLARLQDGPIKRLDSAL